MTRNTRMLVVVLTALLPSIAFAQLTDKERIKAREIARIQAKADAEERAKERQMRFDSAKSACEVRSRQWDAANEVCKPR